MQFINFPEEISSRVRNMAVCFVANTIKVDRRKLNKLFYLVDTAAYKQTAFTLSEQVYIAEPFGPVPISPVSRKPIWDEFSFDDLIDRNNDEMYRVKTGILFDDSEFTNQELAILQKSCQDYYASTGDELSDLTHSTAFPWYIVWHDDRDTGKEVPFDWFENGMSQEELALRKIWRDDAKRNFEAFARLRNRIREAQIK